MKRSELNSICAEIQKRQLIILKADFLEMSKLSHDESSHFEDFFAALMANSLPILSKLSVQCTIDTLENLGLIKIEDD